MTLVFASKWIIPSKNLAAKKMINEDNTAVKS